MLEHSPGYKIEGDGIHSITKRPMYLLQPCIYYKNIGGEKFYIGVYVDDIILAGKTDRNLEEVKTALSTKFSELNYFLGIKVDQKTQNSIWIGQPSHTQNLLETLGMQDCKPVVSNTSKLTKATDQRQSN